MGASALGKPSDKQLDKELAASVAQPDTEPAASQVSAASGAAAPLAPRRRVLLVGIAGASGSGKTTLAEALIRELRSPLQCISADNYFDESKMPVDQQWGRNYETPGGVDWELLRHELRSAIRRLEEAAEVQKEFPMRSRVRGRSHRVVSRDMLRPGFVGAELGPEVVVLLEGFLLFHDPEVAALCGCCVWLDVDLLVGLERRYRRDFNGGDRGLFSRFYQEFVWSAYEENCSTQLANAARLLRLEGKAERGQLLALALNHVRSYLATTKASWKGQTWSQGEGFVSDSQCDTICLDP